MFELNKAMNLNKCILEAKQVCRETHDNRHSKLGHYYSALIELTSVIRSAETFQT